MYVFFARNLLLTIACFVALGCVTATNKSFAAGIRFESGTAPSANGSQRLGGLPPERTTNTTPPNLLDEARSLRQRYREEKAANAPAAAEFRYGVVAAFFDSKTLLKPAVIKDLETLSQTDGVGLALFLSHDNLETPLENRPLKELEGLAGFELPLMRDDPGGRIAKQYGVTKFPTILYETPRHDVVTFSTVKTLDYLFERINAEKRRLGR